MTSEEQVRPRLASRPFLRLKDFAGRLRVRFYFTQIFRLGSIARLICAIRFLNRFLRGEVQLKRLLDDATPRDTSPVANSLDGVCLMAG